MRTSQNLILILMPLVSSAMQDFNAGHIIRALLYPLTSIMGDLSYALMIGTLFAVIYISSDNVAMPIVVFIILWPILSWFVPSSTWYVFGGFIAVSIGFIFAKAFTRRS